MSNPEDLTQEEVFLKRMKSARHSGAVLKARLITLRTDLPHEIVLVFEGDDDKIVYGQWIRRIRPGLSYEPFPWGGKKAAKELKNSLSGDLTRLDEKVFFFVDRGYDDLIGFRDTDKILMTDTYSVENYLVADEVLDDLLRDEFPCHAKPDLRRKIIQTFNKDYSDFLRIMSDINKRLFLAIRAQIELTKRLPTSLRYLDTVEVGKVGAVDAPPEELVLYERELRTEETIELAEAFDKLEPKLRYRGKFAIMFFQKWLSKLAEEYEAGKLAHLIRPRPV